MIFSSKNTGVCCHFIIQRIFSTQGSQPPSPTSADRFLTTESPRKPTLQIQSVQMLSYVWLFVTPWTRAHQASLSITNSQSLLKLMSIELVMPSNHLILCRPLLLLPSIFPSISVFSSESVLPSGGQRTEASASASVLPMNIQGWFPLRQTGWISLQSKGLSRVFSSTTVRKHHFFGEQSSLWSNSHIYLPIHLSIYLFPECQGWIEWWL